MNKQVEAIRQEIKRRRDITAEIFEENSDTYYQGKAVAYNGLLTFIDPLLKEDTQLLAGDYAISHYEQGKTYSALEVHKMLVDAFIAGRSYQKPVEWNEDGNHKEEECKN